MALLTAGRSTAQRFRPLPRCPRSTQRQASGPALLPPSDLDGAAWRPEGRVPAHHADLSSRGGGERRGALPGVQETTVPCTHTDWFACTVSRRRSTGFMPGLERVLTIAERSFLSPRGGLLSRSRNRNICLKEKS